MNNQPANRYYLIVASHDHVRSAVANGFIQANHGKARPMHQLRAGDGIVCYSPRETFGGPGGLQAFTAIGTVNEGVPYIGSMEESDFRPMRRDVTYQSVAEPLLIRPLLDQLSFTRDRPNWGMLMRRGFFEIPAADFNLIRDKV